MLEKEEVEISNAVIENVELTIDDHGILTVWVNLKLEVGNQGFGGFVLYSPGDDNSFSKESGNYAGHFIWRVLQIAGVENWSRLKSKTIRVRKRGGWSGTIEAIGHIVKDDWFNPTEDFK